MVLSRNDGNCEVVYAECGRRNDAAFLVFRVVMPHDVRDMEMHSEGGWRCRACLSWRRRPALQGLETHPIHAPEFVALYHVVRHRTGINIMSDTA
jgi:hypothetical protein